MRTKIGLAAHKTLLLHFYQHLHDLQSILKTARLTEEQSLQENVVVSNAFLIWYLTLMKWWKLSMKFISRAQQDVYADAVALWEVQLQVKTFQIWFCFWKCSIYPRGKWEKVNAALSLTEIPKYCTQLIHKGKDHNTDFRQSYDCSFCLNKK